MDSFRFKVVKIISKEPFKRGRWLCMDFTDPPSNGASNIEDCLSTNRPIDITSSTGQGVSAVAIDNKIEQAMDLVKSHLMYAVREEMDVLNEKINQLTEKISHLETENSLLKANASQDTLALIEQQQHLQQFQQVQAQQQAQQHAQQQAQQAQQQAQQQNQQAASLPQQTSQTQPQSQPQSSQASIRPSQQASQHQPQQTPQLSNPPSQLLAAISIDGTI